MFGNERVVITYGTFDLFHHGHMRLLERAKALGDRLIVGVTSDAFDRSRGKLNVSQHFAERLRAVQDANIADLVIAEEYQGQKISDIKKYGVDVFAIGSDWEGRFDHLERYCDVVYLPRTEGISSTELRAKIQDPIEIGCIGSDYLIGRIIRECAYVSNLNVSCGFSPSDINDEYLDSGIPVASSLQELFSRCSAVYISVPINKRADIIEQALLADKHVLCESPLFLNVEDAKRILELAKEKGLVLMEAIKTCYFPGFERLGLLLETGVIGEIKDIDASFSHVFDELDKTDRFQGSFFDMGATICLPAMAFLGTNYSDSHFTCSYEGEFCTWAKLNLTYDTASATLRVGRGMKTEGEMVITGTDGYVYVPAPWWKTEYFEVRQEDLRNTKKYYFDLAGEGLRYELFTFENLVSTVPNERIPVRTAGDVLAITELVQKFDENDVHVLSQGSYSFNGGETIFDR